MLGSGVKRTEEKAKVKGRGRGKGKGRGKPLSMRLQQQQPGAASIGTNSGVSAKPHTGK